MLINSFKYIRLIVIWHNEKKDTYYAKMISGYYSNYEVGICNSYGHKIVLVIPIEYDDHKVSIKQRLIKKAISFLEKCERS